MTQQPNRDQFYDGDLYLFNHPGSKFPGWLTALIWVVLGIASWIPIFAVIYLIWGAK